MKLSDTDYSFRETDGSLPGSEAFDQNLRQSFHGTRTEVPVANYNRPGATGPDRSGTDELPLLFASVFIHMRRTASPRRASQKGDRCRPDVN
jgi:hypothetical protein